jgi:prepilin-type N-terminal cleavage/methylation domain-containing protein
MKALFRQNSGLTLPEVLLSAVIIAVAVLALVGLFPTALQNVQYGGHMSQALSLAQEMVELIRTQPFSNVSSYNGLDTRNAAPGGLPAPVLTHFNQWANDIPPPSGVLPQGWGTITVVPETGPPDLSGDLLRVTITVTWRERGLQTITLVTYVARYA